MGFFDFFQLFGYRRLNQAGQLVRGRKETRRLFREQIFAQPVNALALEPIDEFWRPRRVLAHSKGKAGLSQFLSVSEFQLGDRETIRIPCSAGGT